MAAREQSASLITERDMTRKSRAGSPPDVDRPLSLGSRSALRLVRKEAGHDWPPSSRDSAAEHAAADVPLGVTSLFQ